MRFSRPLGRRKKRRRDLRNFASRVALFLLHDMPARKASKGEAAVHDIAPLKIFTGNVIDMPNNDIKGGNMIKLEEAYAEFMQRRIQLAFIRERIARKTSEYAEFMKKRGSRDNDDSGGESGWERNP